MNALTPKTATAESCAARADQLDDEGRPKAAENYRLLARAIDRHGSYEAACTARAKAGRR